MQHCQSMPKCVLKVSLVLVIYQLFLVFFFPSNPNFLSQDLKKMSASCILFIDFDGDDRVSVFFFCHQGVLWFYLSELPTAAPKLDWNLLIAFSALYRSQSLAQSITWAMDCFPKLFSLFSVLSFLDFWSPFARDWARATA